ncbi:MAG: hypothetical protein IJG70_09365 [Kiritimatiellae bacterium]|nr:hypothetical protein [Kiritimatiellia bacterium]
MPAWPDEVQSFLRRALRPDYFLGRSNPPLQLIDMVDYRNGFERHRELHDMPLNVWTEKIRSGQCKLRQPP